MKKTFESVVFSGAELPRYSSCTFPAMCKLSDGRLLASFKAAPQKGGNKDNTVLMCVSGDNGRTWSEGSEPFTPPEINGKKTSFRTLYFIEWSAGHLLAVANAVDATMDELGYFNTETEGLKDTFILVYRSDDNGESWSEYDRIIPATFGDVPLPLTGCPFLCADGKIGIQFEVNKPYYATEYWVHHSAVIYSEDGGKTWGNEVMITDDPDVYYWDQRVSVLKDGRVADIFWTFDRRVGDYVNIHLCLSRDNGKTFGEPMDTGLIGQPGNVFGGKGDSVMAVYINREKTPEIRLAQMKASGEWEDVFTVYGTENKSKKQSGSMNDVWAEMGAFSVGHPFVLPVDEDNILVYYYSGPSTDRTDICCVGICLD